MSMFHGGDLQSASGVFNIPLNQWVDLSTGVNPVAYPVGAIDPQVFQALPYLRAEFLDSAKAYYGDGDFIPVPGTQSAIQALPHYLPALPILLPTLGYQEHLYAWEESGASISFYASSEKSVATVQIENSIRQNPKQHLLIINPNNPSTLLFRPDTLRQWARELSDGGRLIVDEAFIDITPEFSLLASELPDNVIVLRSFGKFFGLAGLRVGFVFASQKLLGALDQHIGPWAINGPAQSIVTNACHDIRWQKQACHDIRNSSQATVSLFQALFRKCGVEKTAHHGLFSSYWLPSELADFLFEAFALCGVLLRKISLDDQLSVLRIGSVNFSAPDEVARTKSAINNAIAKFDKRPFINDDSIAP